MYTCQAMEPKKKFQNGKLFSITMHCASILVQAQPRTILALFQQFHVTNFSSPNSSTLQPLRQDPRDMSNTALSLLCCWHPYDRIRFVYIAYVILSCHCWLYIYSFVCHTDPLSSEDNKMDSNWNFLCDWSKVEYAGQSHYLTWNTSWNVCPLLWVKSCHNLIYLEFHDFWHTITILFKFNDFSWP